MARKEELIAIAAAFGIITEGLTVAQLEEALDKSEGYQKYVQAQDAAVKSAEELEASNARVTELEGDLTAANAEAARLQAELDTANETIEALEAEKAAAADVVFTSESFEAAGGKDYAVYNGVKYAFTDRAPKQLQIDGRIYTREELLNNEEVMVSLIVGQSGFVKKM